MTFTPPTQTNPPFTTPPTWPFPTTSIPSWEINYRLRLMEAALIYMWATGIGAPGPPGLNGTVFAIVQGTPPPTNASPAPPEGLVWIDTSSTPINTPGGPAGGDLSGTYPNPTIAKVASGTLLNVVAINPTVGAIPVVPTTFGVIDPNITISFLAPASGKVLIRLEIFIILYPTQGMEFGWVGGGITSGGGPAQSPVTEIGTWDDATRTTSRFRQRIVFTQLITGLVSGQTYTPVLNGDCNVSGTSQAQLEYGGPPGPGNNSAGQAIITVQAV